MKWGSLIHILCVHFLFICWGSPLEMPALSSFVTSSSPLIKHQVPKPYPPLTHPNEVGILHGVGGHSFGYGGLGFCSLFLDLDSLFSF